MAAAKNSVILPDGVDFIPLRVLIVDSNSETANQLASALRSSKAVIGVECVSTIRDAHRAIKKDINSIYVDPIGLGMDEGSTFIFDVRRNQPDIVFVLYIDGTEWAKLESHFSESERQRFSHYYFLDKTINTSEFSESLLRTISLCQNDLSNSLTQERIRHLQNEIIAVVRKAAKNDSVNLPVEVLREIQGQLQVRAAEAEAAVRPSRTTLIYGPRASTVTANSCFLVMPYSQSWSGSVEAVVRQACDETGFEFAIAKAMDGRFVAHDIWQGITGSGIVIADLTTANANVTYEIGLADALGKGVMLLCQESEVPFDFLGHRLILYKDSISGGLSLLADLKKRLIAFRETKNQTVPGA